jgi:hypothetical protein
MILHDENAGGKGRNVKHPSHMDEYQNLYLFYLKNSVNMDALCARCTSLSNPEATQDMRQATVRCRTCSMSLCPECDVIMYTGQICSPNAHDRVTQGMRETQLSPTERTIVKPDSDGEMIGDVAPMVGDDSCF